MSQLIYRMAVLGMLVIAAVGAVRGPVDASKRDVAEMVLVVTFWIGALAAACCRRTERAK